MPGSSTDRALHPPSGYGARAGVGPAVLRHGDARVRPRGGRRVPAAERRAARPARARARRAQPLRLRAVRRAEELEGNLRVAKADPMPTASPVEQEEKAADHLAAVREQATRIEADASRAADRIRADAAAAATELAEQAEAGLRERRAEAARELDRLAGQLAEVHAEMARLAGVLTAESRDG